MLRVSSFLIAIVLIAGMVGCDGNRESYTLTITSTAGGSVVEPGEGTFTYYAGTEVDLVAEADEGYQFLNWSGGLIPVANPKTVAITIVMDRDYSISANFAVPTLVFDWYDLNAIRDDMFGIYILMNDLNSTTPGYEELAGSTANGGKGWQPIGSINGTQNKDFHGTLDGGGHKICDLFINRPDTYTVGLLSTVYFGGGITNLGVVNATVTGYMWVGGLAGGSIGVVDNSYTIASVNGTDYVGGLVGASGTEGIVSNSYSVGNVTGDGSVGGLVGVNGYIVSDCHYTGSVIGNERVGGLVGGNGGTVSGCHSTGTVAGNGTIGGLVGRNAYSSATVNTVSNSYSTGSVTGDHDIGGLVGQNWGNVNDSYSTGSVTGKGLVGGLVGANYIGTVSNSYSTGSVTGNSSVGGLVGANKEATVKNSYSTGSVTGNEYIGGLMGCNDEGTVSHSFWNTETSGQSTSAGGIGKTTPQMQNIATFSGATWEIMAVDNPSTRDPTYIWNIVEDETYPFLSWQP